VTEETLPLFVHAVARDYDIDASELLESTKKNGDNGTGNIHMQDDNKGGRLDKNNDFDKDNIQMAGHNSEELVQIFTTKLLPISSPEQQLETSWSNLALLPFMHSHNILLFIFFRYQIKVKVILHNW